MDRYKVRHRALFCGTSSGKTQSLCAEVVGVLLENPGAVGYIYEPNYRMVRRILVPTLENKWLFGKPLDKNPLVNYFNKSDSCIELIDGQTLWFGGLEEPGHAEGPNVDVGAIDEAQWIREIHESHDTVLRRLRGSGNVDRDITMSLLSTTPPVLAPNRIINDDEKKTGFTGCKLYDFYENPLTKDRNAKVYRWPTFGNTHLTQTYIDDMKRRFPGKAADRWLMGRFATVGGGTFPFDSSIHVHEPPAMVLLSGIRYGVDFGWVNPSAVEVIAYDNDDRVYVLDEFYKPQVGRTELLSEIWKLRLKYGVGPVICDASEAETIAYFGKGDEKERLMPLNALAYKHRREDGIRELGSRFPKQDDGRPRIFISSRCTNLIRELLEYKTDVKENDHAVDATRYALKLEQGLPAPACGGKRR